MIYGPPLDCCAWYADDDRAVPPSARLESEGCSQDVNGDISVAKVIQTNKVCGEKKEH